MSLRPRWNALDCLRGLSIALMMLNIIPGSWEHSFAPLLHSPWAGITLIDLVSPTFLFCVGASIPFGLAKEPAHPYGIVWRRGLILIGLGIFLNAYPEFDWQHLRLPGTLQRIGLAYALTASLLLASGLLQKAKRGQAAIGRIALIAGLLLAAYACLLAFVPVPGFGVARYDPLGSWPTVLDRALFGVEHLYPYWPVNGRILFDPDGLLATIPVCFNLLLGAICSLVYRRGDVGQLPIRGLATGLLLVVLGIALGLVIPVIKNIWTPSFAILSSGFSLCLLSLLELAFRYRATKILAAPALTFGSNALLAYSLTLLGRPFVDHHFIRAQDQVLSLREWIFGLFCHLGSANLASLLFSLLWLLGLYIILLICERRHWFLRI